MEEDDRFRLKRVEAYHGKPLSFVLQNVNGPCPLLAISNVLILRGLIAIHSDYSFVSGDELVSHIISYLTNRSPPSFSDEGTRANYDHLVAEAISIMPQLLIGLDVNVSFNSIEGFEFTREMTVFDVLNIRLVHGWLAEPASDAAAILGTKTYNELVENVVELHASQQQQQQQQQQPSVSLLPNDLSQSKNVVIEDFLSRTASQLTEYGLRKLHEGIAEGEYCVFFRNNHFSVIHKHQGQLYLLVTDQGFLRQDGIMWEHLGRVDGDSHFCSPSFGPAQVLGQSPSHAIDDALVPTAPPPENALTSSDRELALQLQREEEEQERQHALAEQQAHEAATRAHHGRAVDADFYANLSRSAGNTRLSAAEQQRLAQQEQARLYREAQHRSFQRGGPAPAANASTNTNTPQKDECCIL